MSTMGFKTGARSLLVRDRLMRQLSNTHDPDACWEWQGTMLGDYGVMMVDKRRVQVHRLMWHVETGMPLDSPLVVRHYVCHNPQCANPAHLREGTTADNSADMVRDRQAAIERGETVRIGRSKLTVAQEAEIRARFRARGIESRYGNGRELMAEYGIAKHVLHRIIGGVYGRS